MSNLNQSKCPCGGTFKFSKITRSVSCSKCNREKPDTSFMMKTDMDTVHPVLYNALLNKFGRLTKEEYERCLI